MSFLLHTPMCPHLHGCRWAGCHTEAQACVRQPYLQKVSDRCVQASACAHRLSTPQGQSRRLGRTGLGLRAPARYSAVNCGVQVEYCAHQLTPLHSCYWHLGLVCCVQVQTCARQHYPQ